MVKCGGSYLSSFLYGGVVTRMKVFDCQIYRHISVYKIVALLARSLLLSKALKCSDMGMDTNSSVFPTQAKSTLMKSCTLEFKNL